MFRSIYLLTFLFFLPLHLAADCCGGRPDTVGTAQTSKRDYDPLKEYVNSKRSIPGGEKIDNLTLSGDVRTSWAHLTEKLNNYSLRGSNSIPVPESGCSGPNTFLIHNPMDAFEITFNLYVDYVYDRAWAVSWVSFNNLAGLQGTFPCCSLDPQACRGSGTCEGICLRKAYIGYNLCTTGDFRLDIEIGRRPLWTIFDSYIQFQNRFDGVLLFASYNVCGQMDAYIKGGPFVIDERSHHFGYVGEVGLLNIWESRFDIKYSLIDWKKRGKNRCEITNPFGARFLNSQLTVAYWLNSDYLWAKTKIYAAGLINHDASKKTPFVNMDRSPVVLDRKYGFAWYAGFLIGEVCQEGDWSLDINYQYVQARAIPNCDISGIGNGGLASCICLEDPVIPPCPSCCPALLETRANYQGWHFEGLYAFTDNLLVDMIVEFSGAINKELGGRHDYSKFQVQAIYAF